MEKRAYRKRDERQKGVIDRPLSEHDLAILQTVYEYRVMTQAQITRILFGHVRSPAIPSRKLGRLFDLKYLHRDILFTKRGGRGENYYVMDKRGVEALALESPEHSYKYFSSYKNLKNEYIRHVLAVGNFRIILSEACALYGYELDWIPEVRFRAPGGFDRIHVDGELTGIVPDGAFCITRGGRQSILFMELDRGTTRLDRYRSKLKGYLAYGNDLKYYQRFSAWLSEDQISRRMPSMRVLTVVVPESGTEKAGKLRMKYLIEQVQHKELATMKPARRFWFARLADLTPHNILSEPVWIVKSHEPAAALLEEFEANEHIRHG